MLELIIFYLAMLCANPVPCTNPTPHVPGPKCNGFHMIMSDEDGDTGGETGDIPPPPPPPPPPRP